MTNTTVSSGQTITGQTILNGDSISVQSGGAASATSILIGGQLNVADGGAASATSVGVVAPATPTLNQASFFVATGANASGTTIGAYGSEFLSGTDSSVTVDGGFLSVSGPGSTAGTITATSGDAVECVGGRVFNDGAITSSTGNGVSMTSGSATSGGSLSNSGTIVAGASGVHAASGEADISNSGTITGSVAAITGTADSTLYVSNTGTLNVSSSSGTAIALSGGGSVTNFGKIDAGSGVAISGVNRLTISGDSSITGEVVASTVGTTYLELSSLSSFLPSGNATPGTLTGLGSAFVGFQTINVGAGMTWTLSGTNHLSANQTLTMENSGTLTVAAGALTTAAGATIAFDNVTNFIQNSNSGSNTVLIVSDNMGGVAISGFDNTPESIGSLGPSSTKEILLANVAFDASTQVSVAGTLVTVSNGAGASDTLDIVDARNETYRVASSSGGATALYANSEASGVQGRITSGVGGVGSTLDFQVSLPLSSTTASTTAGTPVLLLSDGSTATCQGLKPSIEPGVLGPVLDFTTTVTQGQNTSDLKVAGVNLNGAVFNDASGLPIDFSRVATLAGSDTGIVIDATPPDAPSGLAFTPAYYTDVTNKNSTVFTNLNITGNAVAGSGIEVDDSFGGTSTAISRALSIGGTFQAITFPLENGVHVITATDTDRYGNVSAPSTAYTFTVDGVTPTITALTATPSAAGTLGVGATVSFDLSTSTKLVLRDKLLLAASTGSPTLTLSDGGTATYVAAQSKTTDLVFQTTVLAGQNSADLKVTGLALNGSLPADSAGNILSVAGIATLAGSDTGISIDTAPTVTPTPTPDPTPAPTPDPTPAPAPATGVTSTVGASGGTVFTSVATGASSVAASASGNDVINSLGSDTVQAGGGFDIVYASGTAATVLGGAGDLVFVAGSGAYTAGGGAGVDILYGGSGTSSMTGGAGKNSVIVAGTGNTSLVGGAGTAALMFGGSAANTFTGSAGGADTMVGGAGSNTFSLTAGSIAFGGPNGPDVFNTGGANSLIVEGAGASRINVGSGATTDFGGTGADTYTIAQGSHGTANIIGFKANDHITLTGGFTAADASSAVSTATTGSFGTTLNLSDGTQVNLFGVTITAAQVGVG